MSKKYWPVLSDDYHYKDACADPESFVGGGPNLTFFFFFWGGGGEVVDEGREDPNTTINGPSSARQRNAI